MQFPQSEHILSCMRNHTLLQNCREALAATAAALSDETGFLKRLEDYIQLLVKLDEYDLLITSLTELQDHAADKETKLHLLQKAIHFAELHLSWSTSGAEGMERQATLRSIVALREKLLKDQ